MTVSVTSCARDYAPDQVRSRYVRYAGAGDYRWCEVGEDRRWDIRQGCCTVDDLPPNVATAAIARHNEGIWPSYVEWPL